MDHCLAALNSHHSFFFSGDRIKQPVSVLLLDLTQPVKKELFKYQPAWFI